jgi:hypothetical protein
MQSLTFTPGRAFLSSDSTTVPWTVVFEDEGIAGYFYACDRSQVTQEAGLLDAMLIYNVRALARGNGGATAQGVALTQDDAFAQNGGSAQTANDAPRAHAEQAERVASVEWSPDGLQAALYLDGVAQALYDFAARCGYCRMDFPNFVAEQGDAWRKSTHAWSDAAIKQFEAALCA